MEMCSDPFRKWFCFVINNLKNLGFYRIDARCYMEMRIHIQILRHLGFFLHQIFIFSQPYQDKQAQPVNDAFGLCLCMYVKYIERQITDERKDK